MADTDWEGMRFTPSALRGRRWLAAACLLLALFVASSAPASNSGKHDSADQLIIWVACDDVAALSDAQLDAWKDRGVDGFVCMVGRLRGMGGTQDFTPNLEASLAGDNFALERRLRNSNIAGRAAQRGMKLYLGAYMVNYYNPATPLVDWFDDSEWNNALATFRDFAGAAHELGFAGLAFDQELYPQEGGKSTASWAWDYPGNTHSEAQVRSEAKHRGRQLMSAILSSFPKAELAGYDVQLPETWGELVQEKVNDDRRAYKQRLDINFWNGLTSVDGYGSIHLYDATFYKSPHLGSWTNALQYNQNRVYSYMSRKLSNWDYASSRVDVSPFSWINTGPCGCPWEQARSPSYVNEQLEAFRKWSVGGEFANYVYGSLSAFDYAPYADAMRRASTPGRVDRQAPTVAIDSVRKRSAKARISGDADDNLAVRAVRWRDNRGGHGIARTRWRIVSGDYTSGYDARTHWWIPAGDLTKGARKLTVTVEDIKGHRTSAREPLAGRRSAHRD